MFRNLTILLLFITMLANAQDRTTLVWNRNQVRVQVYRNLSLDLAEKLQYNSGTGNIDQKFAEMYIGHRPANWFRYGAGFRLTDYRLAEDIKTIEKRPMIFADCNGALKKFEFSFSNRLEYRNFSNSKNYFRHRQAFRVNFPTLTDWGMQFYTMEETFQKLNGNGMHLARFYGGLHVYNSGATDISMYYALQKLKVINWKTADIIGVNINFNI